MELTYESEIKEHKTIFALAYQGTDEAKSVSNLADTLPENRVAASA